MKKIIFIPLLLLLYNCSHEKGKLIKTNENKEIKDSLFLYTLDKYIEGNKNNFVQVFVNYEENINRYVFYQTKSMYDLKLISPDDFFYYKKNIIMLYTGLNFLTKMKKNMPSDLEIFYDKKNMFNDIDSTGNFNSNSFNENIGIGSKIWELKIYRNFNDSFIINKNYNGIFKWDASRVKIDTTHNFVRPIVHEDVIE